MRRVLIALVLFLLMVLSSCTYNQNESKTPLNTDNEKTIRPLRVAVQSYYCSAPVELILERGWDVEAGIPFELFIYADGARINDNLKKDKWDVAVTGGAFIFSLADGEIKLIAHQADGTGGNVIYVRKDSPILSVKGYNPTCPEVYGNPDTVRGTTILHNQGTTSNYTTVNWLESIGVKEADVNIMDVDIPDIYTKFSEGIGDCASMTPPASYNNPRQYGWVEAASLQELGAKLLESTVCSNDAYENRRDDIVLFTSFLFQAIDEMNSDSKLTFEVVKNWYKRTGRKISDEEIRMEIKTKPFIGTSQHREIDLYDFAVEYGEYYIKIGKIKPAQMNNIKSGIVPDIMEEVLSEKNSSDSK